MSLAVKTRQCLRSEEEKQISSLNDEEMSFSLFNYLKTETDCVTVEEKPGLSWFKKVNLLPQIREGKTQTSLSARVTGPCLV